MAGGFCVAIATVVLSIVLLIVFWEWLSGGESGSTTIRNIALVAAGLIALPLAIWRGLVANRQAKTAQQGLLNERYQRGAEMLGNEVLAVRLGGIYALQRLAEEWPDQYHIQIMRLFCAFVCPPTLGIRQDVEAVMQMIGSRAKSRITLERIADFKLDLRDAHLPKAQFLNADLSNAMFHNSNLSGANFANTDLTDSYLSCSDLSQAEFYDVNFTRARLWSANLSGAMLQDADLSRRNLHNVNLSGADLRRANLSEAIFQDAKASNALLEGANLSRASFLGADLSGVKFSVGGQQTAQGLTQAQLDDAWADPDNPPELTGVLDAGSGEPLVWRGTEVT